MEIIFQLSLFIAIAGFGLVFYVLYEHYQSEKNLPTRDLIEDAYRSLEPRPFARRLQPKR